MKLETGGVIKMTKDEALRLALQALDIYDYTRTVEESELVSKAINACKEALEQPAQPLDIEILNNLYDMAEERDGDAFDFDHIKFARAIEKAHGIGVNN
jgi:hypothetical protein